MTNRKKSYRPLSTAPIPPGRIVLGFMCILSFLLIFRNADVAIDAIRGGLHLCAHTLIPSLFPFLVLSELMIRSGAASCLGKWLSPLFRLLFDVGPEGSAAVLLGLLSGFPVGARAAATLYETGRIDKEELSRLLCFCNVPSSAFVISAVGISLFGSRAFGMLLYAITIFSALLYGALLKIFRRKNKPISTKELRPTAPTRPQNGITSFTDAVSESARAMLSVCAFVIFFAALVGCLKHSLSHYGLPAPLSVPLFCFFELTGGVAHAAALGGRSGMLLCALAVGWSGLSVHFQIMSICDRCDVSFRPYFVAKATQAILCVLLLEGILLWLRPHLPATDPISSAYHTLSPTTVGISLALFGIAIGVMLVRNGKQRHKPEKLSSIKLR